MPYGNWQRRWKCGGLIRRFLIPLQSIPNITDRPVVMAAEAVMRKALIETVMPHEET